MRVTFYIKKQNRPFGRLRNKFDTEVADLPRIRNYFFEVFFFAAFLAMLLFLVLLVALFVGFAPVDNPKYACCVAIEHGGGGASAIVIERA
jgi:hypothetical protein